MQRQGSPVYPWTCRLIAPHCRYRSQLPSARVPARLPHYSEFHCFCNASGFGRACGRWPAGRADSATWQRPSSTTSSTKSVIVARVDESTVKAYHNVCRHRGVRLAEDRGRVRNGFTCSFHGWSWNIEGENTFLYGESLFSARNLKPEDIARVPPGIVGRLRVHQLRLLAPSRPRESIEPFATYNDGRHADKMRVDWWHSVNLPGELENRGRSLRGGLSLHANPPATAAPRSARYESTVRGARLEPEPQRHGQRLAKSGTEMIDMFIWRMRALSEGMASMTLPKDIAVAESLRGMRLPDDPAEAMMTWRTTLNDAVTKWNREQPPHPGPQRG